MADMLLTEDEARTLLNAAIEREGSATRFAKRCGVSKHFLSQVVNGKPISGKIAEHLGLEKVYRYELTRVKASPEQERYENSRREWVEQNPIIPKHVITAWEEAQALALEQAKADKAS
jgi:hypothetical protein